ncbi:MAG: hypothetical protein ACMXYD_01830 [Candidatus Woesearchaeota archaeon]
MIDETITNRLRNGQEISDKQLEERVDRYRDQKKSSQAKELDLAAVKKEQEQATKEAYTSSLSGIEKLLVGTKEFFGFGIQRELNKHYTAVSRRITSFEAKVDHFEDLFEQTTQKYKGALDEKRQFEQYQAASKELYLRSLDKRDALEVELESLTSQTSPSSMALHEKRDELFEVSKRVDTLYQETGEIVMKLQMAHQKEFAYEANLKSIRKNRSRILNQLSTATVFLDELSLAQEMHGSGSTKGIIDSYENLAITIQQARRFLDATNNSAQKEINEKFTVEYNTPVGLHKAVEEWSKIPRP